VREQAAQCAAAHPQGCGGGSPDGRGRVGGAPGGCARAHRAPDGGGDLERRGRADGWVDGDRDLYRRGNGGNTLLVPGGCLRRRLGDLWHQGYGGGSVQGRDEGHILDE
jgi:hypothetical protein